VNETANCSAVIPCWNEAATIADLVRRVRPFIAQVLVVDDGSSDTTIVEAAAAGATVLRHEWNRGKGAALRTGLTAAHKAGFHWCFTLDADGQHPPERIPAFLQCAAETGAELVVGNRFTGPSAMPVIRRRVNQWMSRQLSRRVGMPLPDSQCGFRLLRLTRWAQLPLTADHFEVESEFLLAFIAAGAQVSFVPVPVVSASRPSRIRPVADAWRWLRWWRHSRLAQTAADSAGHQLAIE
jgi:glycosyltransferase involved in cell wall biosynthesis